MPSARPLIASMDKVIRRVEELLTELEALRDELGAALAESRVSRSEERRKELEALLGEIRRSHEVLKSLYTRLSLVRMRYSEQQGPGGP